MVICSIELLKFQWHKDDFLKVAKKGASELSVIFSSDFIEKACSASFKSIGVFQEILKEACISAKIIESQNCFIPNP